MKILVSYYSRTGTTRKVAGMIAKNLEADIEEIQDTVDRSGIKGYFISGRDGMKKRLTKIEPITKDPAEYDLVVIGTPNWAGNISAPIRTYLTEQKEKIKNKAAFFCTRGGSGEGKVFLEMEDVLGKKPLAILSLSTKEVARGEFAEKVREFVSKLK